MSEEEFKIYVNDKVASIFSKANDDEKAFINHLINRFNDICDENKQLQNNWNELKQFIESELCSKYIHKYDVLDKIKELEGKGD